MLFKRCIWYLILIYLLALTACNGESDLPPTLPQSPTPGEQATVAGITVARPTSATTNAAEPTATLPPPPTLPPAPTATELPLTATPEPLLLVTAEDFGNERNPLTGELVDDPMVLQRRPFTVKLSNSPAEFTRPQSGLNEADIVYEHTTEGYITRFTAIFYGHTPEKVGPIRSARLLDVELPAMYDAALFYSGSSVGVGNRLRNSDFRERVFTERVEDGFYRTGEAKPWEHTLYGRPAEFWQAIEERDLNRPPQFQTFMAFSDFVPEGGVPSNGVMIDHSWTDIEWQYDESIGRYRRWSDEEIHRDGNSNEQVTAANVILVFPFHVLDPTICEQIAQDGTCVHLSVQIQLWGSGDAIVLRDGQRFDVVWHREGRNDMLTFTDQAGDPFPLKIGNSWVQVIPDWLDNPVTILE
jgi:hypothetical protein